ncbi:MAG: hypothetical protein HZA78_11275 [Candidatus Schekmanbacteria bacterium]|nr:hypothetical protein [Candidatus Schekmanbacteria bacterium]
MLSTQKDIQDVKEDIMVALGMSRAIVSAEGPNFATASIAFRKVLIVILSYTIQIVSYNYYLPLHYICYSPSQNQMLL